MKYNKLFAVQAAKEQELAAIRAEEVQAMKDYEALLDRLETQRKGQLAKVTEVCGRGFRWSQNKVDMRMARKGSDVSVGTLPDLAKL